MSDREPASGAAEAWRSRSGGRRRVLVLAAGLVLGGPVLGTGCAGSDGSGARDPAPTLQRSVTDVVEFRARVQAVDPDLRRVTVVDGGGHKRSYYADESVQNFEQIAVGDEVVGTLIGSLAIEVRPPASGERPAELELVEIAERAAPGERPAGHFVRRVTGAFTIDALDRAAGVVTLRGPSGVPNRIPVRRPADLDRVRVGDTVVATFTESMQLEVRKPGVR